MINNIKEEIFKGKMDKEIEALTNGENKDILIEQEDSTFTFTTTNNQKNNKNSNVSTINLGECENKLKERYNIFIDSLYKQIFEYILRKGYKYKKIKNKIKQN